MTHSEERRRRQPHWRRPRFGHRKPSLAEGEPERLAGRTALPARSLPPRSVPAVPGGAALGIPLPPQPPPRPAPLRRKLFSPGSPRRRPPQGSGAGGGRRIVPSLPPRSGAGRRPQPQPEPRRCRGGRRRPRTARGSAWPLPFSRWREPLAPPRRSGGCCEAAARPAARQAGCGRPGRAAGCPARGTRRCAGRLSPATSPRCRPTWCRAAGASASSSAPTPKVTAAAAPAPQLPLPPAAPAPLPGRAPPPLLPGSPAQRPRCGQTGPGPGPSPGAPPGPLRVRCGARGEAAAGLWGGLCWVWVYELGEGLGSTGVLRSVSFMSVNETPERHRGAEHPRIFALSELQGTGGVWGHGNGLFSKEGEAFGGGLC